jgi:hypothetical protein
VVSPAPTAAPPAVERSADVLQSFLSDAAHVPGGVATGIAFPKTAAEVSALVRSARRVLPIGAQSSLTGDATPRGDLLISTRSLTDISLLAGSRTIGDIKAILEDPRGLRKRPYTTLGRVCAPHSRVRAPHSRVRAPHSRVCVPHRCCL